jgi:hypothetical protein
MALTGGQQDRLFKLEAESKDRITEYHSRVGRDAITAISAVAAIIGFLVNSHHVQFIQHPLILKWAMYIIFIFFGVAFIMELLIIRVDAQYAGSFRAYQQATFQNLKDQEAEFKVKQKFWFKLLKKVQLAAEMSAAVGLIALIIFLLFLLNNILTFK